MRPLQLASHLAASGTSLMRGVRARPAVVRPDPMLVLYDMEGCPYCRLVREALTELDLDVLVKPCPKGGARFRAELQALGGKIQFPCLIDAGKGVRLYESLDIVDYLYTAYGGRPAPSPLRLRAIHLPTSFVTSALRAGHGLRKRASRPPDKPLMLWSFEGSPFARHVRETLCELEIPYELYSVGRTEWQDWLLPPVRERLVPDYRPTERNRATLLEQVGRVQVPYLFDPNTGKGLFESADIVDWLERQYALPR